MKMIRMRTVLVMVMVMLFAAGSGCGDNETSTSGGPHRLTDPDAGIDAGDACVPIDAAPDDCCRLYPDIGAVNACESAGLPSGSCGVIACRQPDCSFVRVNFCAP